MSLYKLVQLNWQKYIVSILYSFESSFWVLSFTRGVNDFKIGFDDDFFDIFDFLTYFRNFLTFFLISFTFFFTFLDFYDFLLDLLTFFLTFWLFLWLFAINAYEIFFHLIYPSLSPKFKDWIHQNQQQNQQK